MDEASSKKVKIAALAALIVLAAGVWGYSLLGGGGAAPPKPSPKVDALKAGYDKVEKPPAEDPNLAPPQPAKGARKSG